MTSSCPGSMTLSRPGRPSIQRQRAWQGDAHPTPQQMEARTYHKCNTVAEVVKDVKWKPRDRKRNTSAIGKEAVIRPVKQIQRAHLRGHQSDQYGPAD